MKQIIIFLIIITISLFIFGCVKEEVVCASVWEPVCGVDGKTYSSTCHAKSIEVAHDGECEIKTEEKKSKDLGSLDAPIICTMDYSPVCGVDGKTYSNKCMAGKVKVDHYGEC